MRYSAPVNISADKGMILAYGPDRVNIEMLVEGRWCPGYLEDVWCVPNIGRHLFLVLSATEHGINVIIKRQQIMFQYDGQLVATGQWITDAYTMGIRDVVPREAAEFSIAAALETLQLWNEPLGCQDKCHVRKVPTLQVMSEQDDQ